MTKTVQSCSVVGGGLQAIYYLHQLELPDVVKHLEPFMDEETVRRNGRFFSSWGVTMTPSETYRPCAHYLAPLDPSVRRAFVLKSAVPLPVCPGLSAVLGTMLDAMGQGSDIYVQSGRTRDPAAQWVRPEYLRETLPSVAVEDQPDGVKGWIRLSWRAGVEKDIARLPSIYPLLARRFDDFKRVLVAAGHPNKRPDEAYYDSAENAFIYSQHWALETGGIIAKIFRKFDLTRSMRGLDIGGSYGFLACELAAQGHTMTNIELIDWRTEKVQPWLAQACNVADRVTGVCDRMENLTGDDESYDFICFMGSLLCCQRPMVAKVLQQAMRLLRPGGLLILRENLLIDQTKHSVSGNESRFAPQELHDALEGYAAAPVYFCHLGIERTFEEVKKRWMIYAVSQKPPAAGDTRPVLLNEPLKRAVKVMRRLVWQ